MKFERKELVIALGKVINAVADDEMIPQLENFRFEPKEITGYNMELAVVTQFETGIDALVPADKIYKLLSRLKTPEVDLTVDEGNLKITAEGHKSVMAISEPTDYPKVKRDLRKWSKIPDGFLYGMEHCVRVSSVDATMAELTGVFFDGKNLVATDSLQIAWGELDSEIKGFKPVIMTKVLSTEITRLGLPLGIVIQGGTVAFKYKDTIVMGKAIEAEFPAGWKNFFGGGKSLVDIPAHLKEMVERVKDFSGEKADEALVNFILSGRKILVTYKGESEEIEESAKVKEAGTDINFEVNPFHLKQALEGSERFCLLDNGLYMESKSGKRHYLISVVQGEQKEKMASKKSATKKASPKKKASASKTASKRRSRK